MKIALVCLLSIIGSVAFANEDSLARPTFIHTKHLLPAPWHTGEIVAEADYGGEQDTARLRSLIITVGEDTIKIPQHILDFFPAPRLGTFQLYYSPPPDPDFGGHRYFNVTFRYQSYSYEGIYYVVDRPGAWISIEEGRIKKLTTIENTSETVTTYTEFDPETLKLIRKWSTGEAK